jgi:hypothetical protein
MCIHGAIEVCKTRKNAVSIDEAKKWFETEFRQLFSKNIEKYNEKDKQSNVDLFVAAGNNILDNLHKCSELWDAEVIYNEHELIVPIDRTDDIKMNFKGFIDMVIKTKDKRKNTILYVIDFKTCSWGWNLEKKQDRNLQFQLFLYKHFLCKKFNLDPVNVRTAFVLLKRSPQKNAPVIDFFSISAGPVSVQRALDELNSDLTDMKQRLDKNDFVKNKDSCKDKFGNTCPYMGTDLCPSK